MRYEIIVMARLGAARLPGMGRPTIISTIIQYRDLPIGTLKYPNEVAFLPDYPQIST